MRLLFYCVILWPTALVNAQHCRIAGQIFFADVVDRTITIKTDSDDLVNFNYETPRVFCGATRAAIAYPRKN
jgi:hypothetical protein